MRLLRHRTGGALATRRFYDSPAAIDKAVRTILGIMIFGGHLVSRSNYVTVTDGGL
jgi:hypothetical protein